MCGRKAGDPLLAGLDPPSLWVHAINWKFIPGGQQMSLESERPAGPRALILKGGGVKGLAFAGALRVLERHFSFDIFVGTSAGAIAAVLLAAGYTGAELADILSNTDFRAFVADPWWRRILGVATRLAPFSGKAIRVWIRELLEARISRQTDILMRDLPKRAVVFASKDPQGVVVFDSTGDHDDTPADLAVRYSMTIPFFFQSLKLDEDRVYDGGLRENFPLDLFLERLPGVSYVAMYLASGKATDRKWTWMPFEILQILLRGRELMLVDENRADVLIIDPSPIRTTQFALTADEKAFLVAAGEAAALGFLRDRVPSMATAEQAEAASRTAHALRERVTASSDSRKRRRRALARVAMVAVLAFAEILLARKTPGDRSGGPPMTGLTCPVVTSEPAISQSTSASAERPLEAGALPFGIDVGALSEGELRRYVGQLFLVGFGSRTREVEPSDGRGVARQLIERYGIGSVILFRYNVPEASSPPQKRRLFIGLTDELQAIALRGEHKLPLAISTDQEGGSTRALPAALVTEMPAPMALGGLRQEKTVEEVARMIGEELKLLGVNVNLAPVADININGYNDMIRERSFGSNEQLVTPLVRAWLRGASAAGVLSVAKHFPGHGSTEEGIEKPGNVPVSSYSSSQLKVALNPFRELVRAGVPAIMTSHMRLELLPQLRETATFNDATFRLLRHGGPTISDFDEVGFDGVAITDDLGLPSVSGGQGQEYERALSRNVQRAFRAGHDLLMIAHVVPSDPTVKVFNIENRKMAQQLELPIAAFGEVFKEFATYVFDESGDDEGEHRLRISRFRDALRRVLRFKEKMVRGGAAPTADQRSQALEEIGAEHSRRSDAIFSASFATIAPNSRCPSFELANGDRMLIVFPSGRSAEKIVKAKRERSYGELVDRYRRDFKLLQDFEDSFRDRARIRIELAPDRPQEESFDKRAEEIAQIIRSETPKIALFVITDSYQAAQFATILQRLARLPGFELERVVVVVTGHPNVLSVLTAQHEVSSLVARVTYFFTYTGLGESIERADRLFVDSLARLSPGECLGRGNPPPVEIGIINNNPSVELHQ
jgi:beta-glucosidase-like glycosyl hydrolase/predicted acylesterase/phospholipase RssA